MKKSLLFQSAVILLAGILLVSCAKEPTADQIYYDAFNALLGINDYTEPDIPRAYSGFKKVWDMGDERGPVAICFLCMTMRQADAKALEEAGMAVPEKPLAELKRAAQNPELDYARFLLGVEEILEGGLERNQGTGMTQTGMSRVMAMAEKGLTEARSFLNLIPTYCAKQPEDLPEETRLGLGTYEMLVGDGIHPSYFRAFLGPRWFSATPPKSKW